MMLSCKEATRLASDALDQPLPLRRRLALKLHLMLCPPCNRFARQITRLEQLYRERHDTLPQDPESPGATLSQSAKERMEREIEQEMEKKKAAHK